MKKFLILIILLFLMAGVVNADYEDFISSRNIKEIFLSKNGEGMVVIEDAGDEITFHHWRITADNITKLPLELKRPKQNARLYRKGRGITISPDGSVIAFKKYQRIYIYCLRENRLVTKLVMDSSYPAVIAISHDNFEVAAYQYIPNQKKQMFYRWSLPEGERLEAAKLDLPMSYGKLEKTKYGYKFEYQNRYISSKYGSLEYSPDGKYLVMGLEKMKLSGDFYFHYLEGKFLLNKNSLKIINDFDLRYSNVGVNDIYFSSNGKFVLLRRDFYLQLFNVEDNELIGKVKNVMMKYGENILNIY